MYFKVDKKSDLYDKLKVIQIRMKVANKASLDLATRLGFKQWRGESNMTIAGGIVSFYSKAKPDGYRYTYGSDMPNDFFPKKIKANKELLAKIEALPTVSSFDFTDLIKYDWRKCSEETGVRHGQKRVLFTPGLSFPKNGEILINVPEWITKYKPVLGMIEILSTEYNTLNN